MASIFLIEVEGISYAESKEVERMKQKFEWTGKILEYSLKNWKESWQWARKILSNTTDDPTRVCEHHSAGIYDFSLTTLSNLSIEVKVS